MQIICDLLKFQDSGFFCNGEFRLRNGATIFFEITDLKKKKFYSTLTGLVLLLSNISQSSLPQQQI